MYYGYARVSTLEQNDTSIEVQLDFLEYQAKELGEGFIPKSEKASGKDVEGREVLRNLLLSLKAGDILGVYDNSRLGRNTEENLKVIHDLNKRGVKVQISGRCVDPSNPQDELLFTIESSISTYQRKIQLDKSKAGIKKKKENGDWLFSGGLYGWDVVKKNGKVIVTINEKEANTVRYIFAQYLEGKSSLQISDSLADTDFSKINAGQIRKMLLKPIYMGYYFVDSDDWKKIHQMDRKTIESKLVKSTLYPPIVSEETWWGVLDSWKNITRKHSAQFKYRYCGYELSSILKCGYCGAGYVHSYSKSKNLVAEYYICNIHKHGCSERYMRGFKIIILETIMRACFIITFLSGSEVSDFFVARKDELRQDTESLRADLVMASKEIEDVISRQSRVLDAIEAGVVELSVAKDRLSKYKTEIDELNKKKQFIENQIVIQEGEIDDIIQQESFDIVDEFIHSNPRSDFYKKYLESALMFDDRLEITYMNGKKFVVYHAPSRQKRLLPQKFEVSYKGEFQYKGVIDVGNKTVKINREPTNGDEFQEYVAQNEDDLMLEVHRKLSELN